MTSTGLPRRAQVLVVGKGLAGTAAALRLAQLGASVVIVDRAVSRPVLGESVPPGIRPVLEQLNLWDAFVAEGHRPAYGNRSTWGSWTATESDFIRSPYGNGWHVDRKRIDCMLDDAVSRAGITVAADARVVTCERTRRASWSVNLRIGGFATSFEADFVVDATGRSRQVARMLDIPRHRYDRLIGFVGVLSAAGGNVDTDTFTEIEAVPDGWWYSSGPADGCLVSGYMTDMNAVTTTTARSEEGWMALLRQTASLTQRVERYGYRLRGHIHAIAADSTWLERVTGDGFCAAGDAAAAYDPLSSQGILSALTTGCWAAEAIAMAERGGLTEYEERIRHLYAQYLAQWLGYYALEMRWPSSDFWKHRHQLLAQVLVG